MKNFLTVRVPSVCICFTLLLLANAVLNLLGGIGTEGYDFTVLVLFLIILLCQAVDIALDHVEFRTWRQYCITESLILYVVTLTMSRIFFWPSFSARQLIIFTTIFLLIVTAVFSYFRKLQRMQADEINALIDKMQSAAPRK